MIFETIFVTMFCLSFICSLYMNYKYLDAKDKEIAKMKEDRAISHQKHVIEMQKLTAELDSLNKELADLNNQKEALIKERLNR